MSIQKYDLKKIGALIRSERKGAGFKSAENFGRVLNIGRSQVEQIERGERLPDLDTLVKMAEMFNCEIGYLLCEHPGKTKTITDIMAETGLSETAVNYLKTQKYEPYVPELLSLIIESEHFPVLIENLRKSVECKNSSLVRFQNELADDMKQIIDKMGGTIEEYSPGKSLAVDDAVFDRSMMMLSQISPNMTALSRADAIKFHLQEAERAFRLAAEDAINK